MGLQRSVLIISADEHLRQTIALIMQQAGYSVAAESLSSGFPRLADTTYDLIVIDTNQPSSKFIPIEKELHKLAPYSPILLLTNHMNAIFPNLPDGQFITVLEKPIDPACILDSAATLLAYSE